MNLNEIAGGGLQELFSHEMEKVLTSTLHKSYTKYFLKLKTVASDI